MSKLEKFFKQHNLRILGFHNDDYDVVYPDNIHSLHKKEYNSLKIKPKKFKCNCIEYDHFLFQILVTDIKNIDDYSIQEEDVILYEFRFPMFTDDHILSDPFISSELDYFDDTYADYLKLKDFNVVDINNFRDKKILYKYNLLSYTSNHINNK